MENTLMRSHFAKFTLLAVMAAGALLSGCKPRAAKVKESDAPVVSQGLMVGTLDIVKGPIENRLTLSGVLAPWEQVAVMSKLPGKLISTSIKEGQSVARDEVVALVNQDMPGQDYKDIQVKAPMAGVIAKVMLDPGSMVSPAVPIASIINVDQLKVTVNVIESDISKVTKGMRADIEVPAYPDRKFQGSVSNVLPVVDPMSHTAKVEIQIPNSNHNLKPGMSATVSLLLGKHSDAVAIPRDAIIEKMNEKYVYLFDNGIAKKTDVQTGFDDGHRVEVVSGIGVGARLITTDLNVLKDGTKVRARE
jgi:membrane fusion protein (multidrug efflux system)